MSDKIPPELELYVCPECGRREWSMIGWSKRHHSRGERCPGVPVLVTYIFLTQADAPSASEATDA